MRWIASYDAIHISQRGEDSEMLAKEFGFETKGRTDITIAAKFSNMAGLFCPTAETCKNICDQEIRILMFRDVPIFQLNNRKDLFEGVTQWQC